MAQTSLIEPTHASVLELSSCSQSAEAGIVSRTVLKSPDLRVVHFSFAEGQELTAHSSDRRALVQVLSGECEFFFNEAWHALAPGSLLHLPAGHSHAVRASRGPFTFLLTLSAKPE